jgi:hypothetical protein
MEGVRELVSLTLAQSTECFIGAWDSEGNDSDHAFPVVELYACPYFVLMKLQKYNIADGGHRFVALKTDDRCRPPAL